MRGLLKKDLIMMQGSFKSIPFILVLYIAIGCWLENIGLMMGMLAVVTAGIASSSLISDEAFRWDRYVLTMPVSRKMVIRSKFVLLFLTVIPTVIISVLLTLLLSSNPEEDLLSTVIILSMMQFMFSGVIPCTLKWGARSARIVMAVGSVIVAVIFLMLLIPIMMIDPTGVQTMEPELGERTIKFIIEAAIAVFALFSLAVTAISYKVALRIYENKEF